MLSVEEYELYLKKIIKEIQAGEVEEKEKQLEELYNYKPVRLLWYTAKGELLLSQGKISEAWNSVAPYCRNGISYAGTEEFRDFHIRYLKAANAESELERATYYYSSPQKRIQLKREKLEPLYEKYGKEGSIDDLLRLAEQYYRTDNIWMFLLLSMRLNQLGHSLPTSGEEWYYQWENYTYLEEKLLQSREAIILVQDETNRQECDLLCTVLHELGHPVYMLLLPERIDTDMLHTKQLVNICVDNRQEYEDATVLPVVEALSSEGKKEDNRAELINYLCESILERRFGLILTTGTTLYQLLENPILQKHIECLTNFDIITQSESMCFGWVGNYLAYISDIYGYDVEKDLQKKPECDFSIVVPARNSAGTLYYTLQTCLNQDYTGSYEIVVSDNSTNGCMEVWHVCKDLQNEHLRYVKTPRDLSLSKSFEFGFLQARGEFIFSIGSDDGICPWALSIIKSFMEKYPEEEVIEWKRGYYAWQNYPGYKRDEFVIPGQFKRGEYDSYFKPQMDYFAETLKYSFNMYRLPTMYVNSGFRHSYFHTLLEKTGRLWDGCSQDLYMGVISAAICENVLNIDFPLTMVGISGSSLGYLVGQPIREEDSTEAKKIRASANRGGNVGIFLTCGITTELPVGQAESISLYDNLYRAIQLGVLPNSWRGSLFDYKKIYTEFFNEHICLDDKYDMYLHYARYQAEKRGSEFLKWFDKTIYESAVRPKYYRKREKKEETEKSYKTGISNEGELVLDASEHGVTNIKEAVDLFTQLIYWTPEMVAELVENKN